MRDSRSRFFPEQRTVRVLGPGPQKERRVARSASFSCGSILTLNLNAQKHQAGLGPFRFFFWGYRYPQLFAEGKCSCQGPGAGTWSRHLSSTDPESESRPGSGGRDKPLPDASPTRGHPLPLKISSVLSAVQTGGLYRCTESPSISCLVRGSPQGVLGQSCMPLSSQALPLAPRSPAS